MKLYVQVSDSFQPATAEQVVTAALNLTSRALRRGTNVLTNPRLVREFVMLRLSGLPHEVFAVIHLDNRNRFLQWEEMFRGTLDSATVHPREVVKAALVSNAASVILVHNHPSGVPEPSQADDLITRRLREALALIDVRVLDHLIIGDQFVTSFAERGML